MEDLKKIQRHDRLVLEFAKSIVSKKDRKAIEYELKESGNCYNFLITDSSLGEEQDCEDPFDHGYRYCDQTCNGGHTGDQFAGTVSIPLGHGKWLQFNYSM